MTLDPRPARSRTALVEATIKALNTPEPASLNITDLVKAAGVSRPTFYQYFSDINTLIHTAALEKLDTALNSLPEADPTDPSTLITSAASTSLLTALQADAVFFRNVLDTSGNSSLVEELVTFLTHRLLLRGSATEQPKTTNRPLTSDYAQFIAAGAAWLTVRWLRTDFTGPNTAQAMGQRLSAMIQAATS
ncbi:TetR/AcrR family transcriptional regulator [Rothia sp. P5764]|uniref:TetR/AcrR family transcriptional regulator n=1 Tax=unclassified Rothia (in: high G+C Gram-positive bacteria) TaxID=2689056 RepID=UPI003AC59739